MTHGRPRAQWPQWPIGEPTRSSHSRFKMVWHQFSSLVTSLIGMFVQFSLGRWDQVHPFSSVHELFWPWLIDLAGWVRLWLDSVIESSIVWEEQRSSSRSPPMEILAHPAKGLSPGWRHGELCWPCLLACLSGVWCGVYIEPYTEWGIRGAPDSPRVTGGNG